MNTKNVHKFEKGVYMQVNPINCSLADQFEFARRIARLSFSIILKHFIAKM